jgi:hypothetical protein
MSTEERTPIAPDPQLLNLPRYSRFRNQPVFRTADGALFFGVYRRPVFSSSSRDRYHTVMEGEELRLDSISYRYYRTPELWWALAVANNLVSVFDDVAVGDVLLIPDIASVVG